jgi:hypothetical protein
MDVVVQEGVPNEISIGDFVRIDELALHRGADRSGRQWKSGDSREGAERGQGESPVKWLKSHSGSFSHVFFPRRRS